MTRLAPLALVWALLLPTTAEALTVKLCVKTDVDYVDAGFGEDHWTTAGPTTQLIRGALLHVYEGQTQRFADFLGDGIGTGDPGIACTTEFTVASAGTLDLYLFSYGVVQGNDLYVYDTGGSLRSAIGSRYVSSSTTYTATIATTGNDQRFYVFNVYQAAAYALYRHAGGMTVTYNVEVGDPTGCANSGASCNDYEAGIVYISADVTPPNSPKMSDNKFLIVHEMGHRLGDLKTQDVIDENNVCSLAANPIPCDAYGYAHNMRSGEYAGCALAEGFAHFYSADVWNSHGETGCWFKHFAAISDANQDPVVNCESANTDFPARYLETQGCTGRGTSQAPDLRGCGVELDWLRVFWDVHTNAGSGLDPSFTTIVSWLDTATPWTQSYAYNELDEEADDLQGALNTVWDAVKGSSGSEPNGVAHPYQ